MRPSQVVRCPRLHASQLHHCRKKLQIKLYQRPIRSIQFDSYMLPPHWDQVRPVEPATPRKKNCPPPSPPPIHTLPPNAWSVLCALGIRASSIQRGSFAALTKNPKQTPCHTQMSYSLNSKNPTHTITRTIPFKECPP